MAKTLLGRYVVQDRGNDILEVSPEKVGEVFIAQYEAALKVLPPDKAASAAYFTTSDYIDYVLESVESVSH